MSNQPSSNKTEANGQWQVATALVVVYTLAFVANALLIIVGGTTLFDLAANQSETLIGILIGCGLPMGIIMGLVLWPSEVKKGSGGIGTTLILSGFGTVASVAVYLFTTLIFSALHSIFSAAANISPILGFATGIALITVLIGTLRKVLTMRQPDTKSE